MSAMSASENKRIVRVGPLGLEGILGVPESAAGLVVFAHGSGSSRLSCPYQKPHPEPNLENRVILAS